MKRNAGYLFAALILLIQNLVQGQPLPCGPDPEMTPNCIDACVICDINGYVGINNNPQAGQEPPGFCTNTAHHMQWIAFIAGSTNLTITVTPSNCEEGDGLEVGIYASIDCNTFQLVSNCDGDIQEGQTGVFSNTVPLVIGQYYYFVMDGNMDDICDYIVRVTSGTTMVPPLIDAGPLEGPDIVCQFQTETYTIPEIPGATSYTWTIDGSPAGEGISAEIEFTEPGIHELCVSAFNVCDTAAPACQVINVHPSGGSTETLSICTGDCVSIGDTIICDEGIYHVQLTNIAGCDSIVILTLLEQAFVETDISTTICTTDSIQVGQFWFHLPGIYDITLAAVSGCDSIIHLELQTVACEINGQLEATPVLCSGVSSGELNITIFSGTLPFMFNWQTIGDTLSGEGTIDNINTPVSISDLPAGMYSVTITDISDNDLILTATITEPTPLILSMIAAEYNGFNITCTGSMDGQLSAEVQGGTPPYMYTWSTGDTSPQLLALAPQLYSLTVSDASGCTITDELTLVEPDPLVFNVLFVDPGCDAINSGNIHISSSSGGIPPYQFALSGGPFVSSGTFEGLGEGLYSFLVLDANGCTADYVGSLTGSSIPVIEAGSDIVIELGYGISLSGMVDDPEAIIEWTPSTGLSCTFCLDPTAMPFMTTVYTLQAVSADGCIVTDSLTVSVHKSEADVYIPNIFSPNGDGINDLFTIYGGPSVKQVDKLSVFSRWGDHIVELTDFLPNSILQGWDGTFRDKLMQPGVYAWIAEIRFLDDEVVRYKGDITLIR